MNGYNQPQQFNVEVPQQTTPKKERSTLFKVFKVIIIIIGIIGLLIFVVPALILAFVCLAFIIGEAFVIGPIVMSSSVVMIGSKFMKKGKISSILFYTSFIILILALAVGGYFHEVKGLTCSLQESNWNIISLLS